jgi:hypothetical protein
MKTNPHTVTEITPPHGTSSKYPRVGGTQTAEVETLVTDPATTAWEEVATILLGEAFLDAFVERKRIAGVWSDNLARH